MHCLFCTLIANFVCWGTSLLFNVSDLCLTNDSSPEALQELHSHKCVHRVLRFSLFYRRNSFSVRLAGNNLVLRNSYCSGSIASIINVNISIHFLEIFIRFPCCISLQPMSPIPMKAVRTLPLPSGRRDTREESVEPITTCSH